MPKTCSNDLASQSCAWCLTLPPTSGDRLSTCQELGAFALVVNNSNGGGATVDVVEERAAIPAA
eukprot:1320659-Pyramimonas_sp.AAC.1